MYACLSFEILASSAATVVAHDLTKLLNGRDFVKVHPHLFVLALADFAAFNVLQAALQQIATKHPQSLRWTCVACDPASSTFTAGLDGLSVAQKQSLKRIVGLP